MDELMLRIDHVSKQYVLGQIGGTTLRDEFQRLNAKIRGKEDPTKRIGAKDYNKGEKFLALDQVSFDVKKGERVGIIGHNGAGKSTLLKLISRVTAPTGGTIGLNGRVASMLEVGTGFHPELTGRENIYMNGAILGMKKKENDSKIEKIIEFSEVRQFIDTPVKRYSSGMYVKLAFSVAAHLDSEIMIMDEVLAVGDMAFQQKCLTKMRDVSNEEGRTILYVSHNMNTIRQLCGRVVVLDHGKLVYDGDVEKGISVYFGTEEKKGKHNEFSKEKSLSNLTNTVKVYYLDLLNDFNDIDYGQKLRFVIGMESAESRKNVLIRFSIFTTNGTAVASSFAEPFDTDEGKQYQREYEIDTSGLAPGSYFVRILVYENDGRGIIQHDYIANALSFDICSDSFWNHSVWGQMKIRLEEK